MRRPSAQPLIGLLRRHPFIHADLLADLFGAQGLAELIKAAGTSIQVVDVAGLGGCCAERREPAASLLGIHRIAIARDYALHVMGGRGLQLGLSPGAEADAECYWEGGWWRIWVDVGVCAPEALGFIDGPPKRFGGGVRDVVVVVRGTDRLEQVARLVARSWPSSAGEVLLAEASPGKKAGVIIIGEHRSVRPRREGHSGLWSVPNHTEVFSYLRGRQSGSRHRSLLADRARRLDQDHWNLLVEIGSNPLLKARELATVRSSLLAEQAAVVRRVAELEQLRLVETPAAPDPRIALENRMALTWRGVELLAAYAGTTVETLRRRQPWPLRSDPGKKGKTVYSLRWLRNHRDHQRLAQQFALGLIEGARRVSRPTGGVEIELQTTIGGRLVYEENGIRGGDALRSVSPDAICRADFWKAPWLEGKVGPRRRLARRTLLIEIDRSTMAASRVSDRLDRYAEVWTTMAELHPALVWVVEGTPYREAQVLSMLAERRLPGWTATLDRLVLPAEDAWWTSHLVASLEAGGILSGLDPADFGGICPWRPIWTRPGVVQLVPLLDREPWHTPGVQPKGGKQVAAKDHRIGRQRTVPSGR